MCEEDKQSLLEFLHSHRTSFAKDKTELGRSDFVQHAIDTGDARPVSQRFYRTSPEKRNEIDRQVFELLQLGRIEPSTSEWRAPVVLVKKADGTWRLCCDYRKLNSVTWPQSFPLPLLEDVWDAIGEKKAQVLSCLDLRTGFWQLEMASGAKHSQNIVCYPNRRQWRVMPYGLTNSPITFMRTMHKTLHGLLFKCCIVYVDDIIVYSANMAEHLVHLKQVFERLHHAGLKLNPSKCTFAASQVKYLGHILSAEGIRPNPEKTSIVDTFPVPKDVQQVRSFLGLTNYYKRFIQGYSVLAAPMFKLLRKDTPFHWDNACQEAFQELKYRLVIQPILVYPDMAKRFYLTTDASNTGIGFILSQHDDKDREVVIAYGGRALRGAEAQYPTTQLEYLAVVEGIKTYHPYLVDKPFTVVTDHKPLIHSDKFHPNTGRLGRWALYLQDFNFDTIYKSGKTNVNADTLSRVPHPSEANVTNLQMNSKSTHVEENDADSVVELCDLEPVDMAELQRQCPEVGPLYAFHKDGILPADKQLSAILMRTEDQYVMDEDVLFHVHFPGNRRKAELMVKQLVVPSNQRQTIVSRYHDDLVSGAHQGIDRTYAHLV